MSLPSNRSPRTVLESVHVASGHPAVGGYDRPQALLLLSGEFVLILPWKVELGGRGDDSTAQR